METGRRTIVPRKILSISWFCHSLEICPVYILHWCGWSVRLFVNVTKNNDDKNTIGMPSVWPVKESKSKVPSTLLTKWKDMCHASDHTYHLLLFNWFWCRILSCVLQIFIIRCFFQSRKWPYNHKCPSISQFVRNIAKKKHGSKSSSFIFRFATFKVISLFSNYCSTELWMVFIPSLPIFIITITQTDIITNCIYTDNYCLCIICTNNLYIISPSTYVLFKALCSGLLCPAGCELCVYHLIMFMNDATHQHWQTTNNPRQ